MSMMLELIRASEAQVEELLRAPEGITEFLEQNAGGPESLDLEKTWHGLHYLLTGDNYGGEDPWCYLVEGGWAVGEVDTGYGPARALRPAEVARFAAALNSVSVDELRGRFKPQEMMELSIYPQIWDRDPAEDDTLGWLIEYFKELQPFVHETARRGMGLVLRMW